MATGNLGERLTRASLPAALVVGSFAASVAPVADGDIFWHLAAGREMLARHALLRVDPFSVSAAGRPWPDVHWLFQLGAYGVYLLGGLAALVLVKSAVVAAASAVLYRAVDRRARPLFVPAFLAAIFLAHNLLLVRPVVVTLLLIALFYLQLERHQRDPRLALLLPLPLLEVVWANVQGLFALGLALIGAYLAGALATAMFGEHALYPFAREGETRRAALLRAKHTATALALCVLGCFVTPFGAFVASLPARLFGRILPVQGNVFSATVAENVPPFVLERTSPAEVWHVKWFLLLLAAALVLGARRVKLAQVLVLAGFVVLALMSNRNVALLYFVAPAVAASLLAPRFARLCGAHGRVRLVPRLLVPATVVVAVGLCGVAAAREPSVRAPAPFRFPSESASIIARLRTGGEVFSADHQGGYLAFRLYPRFRPFIDTRLILHTAREYEDFLGLLDDPARFDAFQRRHEFAAIVLPVAYPERYLGLVRHLYRSPEFKLAYTDGSEVLFLRREGWADDGVNLGDRATTEALLAHAAKRYGNDERLFSAARLQIATLDVVVGEAGEAEHVLSGVHTRAATALSARVRLAMGELDTAEELGNRALERDVTDVAALDVLASVSARRGELRRAEGFLRKALAIDPYDGEATNLLASMEERQHER